MTGDLADQWPDWARSTWQFVVDGDRLLSSANDLALARAQLAGAALPQDRVEARGEIEDFMACHPDAAHRSCAEGHLTGSGLVVDSAGERTLLMLHAKLGRWFQPGGHADGNANLAGVALAEASEETGLPALAVVVPAFDVDIHMVPLPGEAPHRHLDVRYLIVAPPGARAAANHESLALRWVNESELDDLEPPVDASTRRLVVRGLHLARHLLDHQ